MVAVTTSNSRNDSMHEHSSSSIWDYSRIVRRAVFVASAALSAIVLFGPSRNVYQDVGLGYPVKYFVWSTQQLETGCMPMFLEETTFRPTEFVILLSIWTLIITVGFWSIKRIERK